MASKDYAHIQTDEELAALEARIAEVYGNAASEMSATVNDYFDSYAQRYEQYLKEYNAGNITKEEFQQWELNQIGRGERYEAMANALANRFVNADEVAMAYVNDATPSVYSLNRNYSNYSINQLDSSIDFTLWDESTVRNLLLIRSNLMPYYPQSKAIKRGIDLNYGKQQIRKSVTSGILQGKSLSRIARDLMNRIHGMSLASALRSARTAITAAENAGRQDSYDEAADMGLKMEKVWLATLDGRTRTAHQQADFQVVKYNEMFDVGGESLMYPGDASHGASGWNLYNCRCTMFEKPEGMSMDDFERWARDPLTGNKEKVTGESYEDWLNGKQEELAREQASTEGASQNDLNNSQESLNINQEAYKTFNNGSAARDYFDENGYDEWVDGLYEEQKDAIDEYTGNGYNLMNAYLRYGQYYLDDPSIEGDLIENIDNLSSAISDYKLDSSITTYRGCSDEKLANIEVGQSYTDAGFGSSSVLESSAFDGDQLMEINVPKSTGAGAWLGEMSGYQGEYEFLLQRGSYYTVTGIQDDYTSTGGKHYKRKVTLTLDGNNY